jgi:2'-5' RNA ligase
MNFTQKYTIVSLLEPQPVEYEFSSKNWPLHVTLAATFSVGTELFSFLNNVTLIARQYTPIKTHITETALFGKDNDMPVTLVENTAILQQLHEELVAAILTAKGAFNEPAYTLQGYKPHITQTDKVLPDTTITINNITVIDMFPNENPHSRKILLQIQL